MQANANPPVLRTHDRYGNRIDEVEFHPAWHRLLGHAVTSGLTDAWGRPAGHLRRAAGFFLWSQAESGHGCPVSMTHAAVAGAANRPGSGRRVGAAADLTRVRGGFAAARGEGRLSCSAWA